ncbi:MAG: BMP family protein [Armatimonadetes bacterium]|nr:BMP family protein [Armatimonadota bacterium]
MKNLLPLFACAASVVALIGCGSSAPEDNKLAPPSSGREKAFKVALLTPGPVSDSGWNAMAFDGLEAIKKDLNAVTNQRESTGTKIKDDLRSYAQDKYNLVIGHGYEYNDPAVEVAKDFPGTVFVTSSGGKFSSNAGAFRFYLEQGFYIAGYFAGEMSRTGTIAMIGGPDVPSIRSTFKGFKAGAEAAKPGIRVIETFTGKENDIAAAKQATAAAITEGADFVIHQANAAAQGVFDACKEKGVYAFGANADQNSNPSGAVIGSAIIVARPAFLELAKEVQSGNYKGSVKLVGMDKGAIDFILNPTLAAKIPAEVLKKIDDLRAKISKGELTVPKDEF